MELETWTHPLSGDVDRAAQVAQTMLARRHPADTTDYAAMIVAAALVAGGSAPDMLEEVSSRLIERVELARLARLN